MKIKITLPQLETIHEVCGDVDYIEIEEGNGGNIVFWLDGLEEVIIAENGDVL